MAQTWVGMWGPTEDATKDIQDMCDQVKTDVEKQTDQKYKTYKAYKYRSQIQSGSNYIIKVHVGGHQYLHLMVYQCPPGETLLGGVDQFHSKDDPLEPF